MREKLEDKCKHKINYYCDAA